MNSVITAAAASALLGSALLVSLIWPLELVCGSKSFHFALQKAVAARVSVGEKLACIHLWRLLATGVVTSPNYPGNYPNNLEKTETIQVEQGLVLLLQFTAFDVSYQSTCPSDHLTITDGDGTTLMGKTCGSCPASSLPCSFLPAAIRSRSNVVNFLFVSNSDNTKTGWSVSWIAVTPGECQQYVWIRE